MDASALEEALGYVFKDKSLLETALRHPSAGGEDNQRLEFLGDAALELSMSEIIFRSMTQTPEGGMTRLRAHRVCQDALAAVAEGLNLGSLIVMDKSCEAGGGRENPSVLSDALEAVLAAVFLDGGYGAALKTVERLWQGREFADVKALDPKSALMVYLQSKDMPAPVYETVGQDGPPHLRTFTSRALCDGRELARGTGGSKKKAEQEAAKLALQTLKSH